MDNINILDRLIYAPKTVVEEGKRSSPPKLMTKRLLAIYKADFLKKRKHK
jgi:hypothetical protein